MKADRKILLVDDEPRVLLALHRMLSTEFIVDVGTGPEDGLRALAERGPFGVVVSDFQMPGLDGVHFLAAVKDISPDTVRIMLTGQADLNATIGAVNQGSVFRFLTKPCPAMLLARAIEDGLAQHRLIVSEREVLRQTLMGSVALLTEILGEVCPDMFSSSRRINSYVGALAGHFGLQDAWQLEAAAMLFPIGRIASPLSAAGPGGVRVQDSTGCNLHPAAGARLLHRIDRLETTAQIVALQRKPYREYLVEAEGVTGQLIATGGQILHAAIDLDGLLEQGFTLPDALAEMRTRVGEYRPELLDALEQPVPADSWPRPAMLTAANPGSSVVPAPEATPTWCEPETWEQATQ
jgi:response regulator RpfG family c-di-GMP phosphodiesterase